MAVKQNNHLQLSDLPESEQTQLLKQAREQAYAHEGKHKARLKLMSALLMSLVTISFLLGFGQAAAYYFITGELPSNQLMLIIAALSATVVIGSWRSVERRILVWLFNSYIADELSRRSI